MQGASTWWRTVLPGRPETAWRILNKILPDHELNPISQSRNPAFGGDQTLMAQLPFRRDSLVLHGGLAQLVGFFVP